MLESLYINKEQIKEYIKNCKDKNNSLIKNEISSSEWIEIESIVLILSKFFEISLKIQ